MSPTTVPSAWNVRDGMSRLNVSPPTKAGPLSHALTVNVTENELMPSTNVPAAPNSSPLPGVAQKLEPKVNDVKELAVRVSGSPPGAAEAKNDPCVPVASCVTSKVKVIRPPSGSGIVPVPFNSPLCGAGGCGHASSLGVSGFRASLHAVATARSATAAADTLRELVRFMGAPLLERLVREPLRQNADRLSRAQQRAARPPDAAQPQRPLRRRRDVARGQHHAEPAWPVRSTVASVSDWSAGLSGR